VCFDRGHERKVGNYIIIKLVQAVFWADPSMSQKGIWMEIDLRGEPNIYLGNLEQDKGWIHFT
jgi:hypothetical protein